MLLSKVNGDFHKPRELLTARTGILPLLMKVGSALPDDLEKEALNQLPCFYFLEDIVVTGCNRNIFFCMKHTNKSEFYQKSIQN